MWHLKLDNGVTLSEQVAGTWDNVPGDVRIKKAALILPTRSGLYYTIDLAGQDRYCIARCATAGIGALGPASGYCLYGQLKDFVTELEVLPSGSRLRSYAMDQCQLPDSCWRMGV